MHTLPRCDLCTPGSLKSHLLKLYRFDTVVTSVSATAVIKIRCRYFSVNLTVHVVTARLDRVDIIPMITTGCCGCVCFDSSDAVAPTPEVRMAAKVLLPIVGN